MTVPGFNVDLVSEAVGGAANLASLRNLAWNLTPGTVSTGGAVSVMATVDGEGFQGEAASIIPVISIIGPVFTGDRVMILSVPPAGNYIIARTFASGVSEWTSYDVAFTSSGVTPDVGAGSVTGRWMLAGWRTIDVEVATFWGAGTSQGTGRYSWSTPFTATDESLIAATGACYMFDSGVANRTGIVSLASPADTYFVTASPTTDVGAGAPNAWTSGDQIRFSITHEIVSFF